MIIIIIIIITSSGVRVTRDAYDERGTRCFTRDNIYNIDRRDRLQDPRHAAVTLS